MPNQITAVAPPSTTDVTSRVLATMQALSGVVTDYNVGSQIRTQTESLGSVVEQQGVWSQAIAFQALVYSAMTLFGIFAETAVPASGTVNIQTAQSGTGPAASQNVSIPAGTLVATAGGIQYATSAAALLTTGSSGVPVAAVAVIGGLTGNVIASGVSQIVSTLSYPLFVVNPQPMAGGLDAETPTQTFARFAAKVRSIGLASPGAIANAAIGVVASGTGETCLYSTTYEPWAAAGATSGSGVAGYTLVIDNGTGTASSGLIAAVTSFLNGGLVSGATNAGASQGVGFRDAGVPYTVVAVQPTLADVAVSGTVGPLSTVSAVQSAYQTAISGFFTLPFGTTAQSAPLAATVANSAPGVMESLVVSLRAHGSGSSVSGVSCGASGRVILGNILLTLVQSST